MIRAILWKELREQAAILIALVALGAGIIVASAALGGVTATRDPLEFRAYGDPARIATLILTMVGGLVCGAMLFANEHENGTADFLYYLPANRHRLWWGKFTAGLVLTSFSTFLFTIVAGLAGIYSIAGLIPWMLWLFVLAYAALTAGALGSAAVKNVLPACGIGILVGPTIASLACGVALIGARYLHDHYQYFSQEVEHPTVAIVVGPMTACIVSAMLSYLTFITPDYRRKQSIASPGIIRETVTTVKSIRTPTSRYGVRVLMWLVYKQWKWPSLVLLSIALMFGLILVIPDVPRVLMWPIVTASLGTLAGVFTFSPEQMAGSHRFWAERSLPIGRLWLAKVAMGFATLVSSLIVFFAIPLFAGIFNSDYKMGPSMFWTSFFRSMLVDADGPILAMLFLWPIYTFAASLIAGMCFQKPVVSIAVGAMTGGSLAAMWIPSMLSGGLMHWQLWPAAFFVILGSRWLMHGWALGRIGSRQGLIKLAILIAVPLGLISVGIAYRAYEVPYVEEIDDDLEFAATIPTNDDQQAGRDVKRVLAQLKPAMDDLRTRQAMKLMIAPQNRLFGPRLLQQTEPITAQMYLIATSGYPTDRPDYDRFFADFSAKMRSIDDEWKKIRTKPTGVVIDPTDLHVGSMLPEYDDFRQMMQLMSVRGLKAQADGDPSRYLDDLESILAAIRSMKSRSTSFSSLIADGVEYSAMQTVMRWLERADDDPKRLSRLRALLDRHAAEPAEPAMNAIFAQVIQLRNSIRNPQAWYPRIGEFGLQGVPSRAREQAEQEANIMQFAWNVPWEKQRLHRAIGLINSTKPLTRKTPEQYLNGIPGLQIMHRIFGPGGPSPNWLRGSIGISRPEIELRRVANLRALSIVTALRLYQAETGKAAQTLDELVPKYVPAVPIDPFSQKPFRYELSNGKDRVVYLNKLPDPLPTPGTDFQEPLTRDQWNEFSTVLGGIVQFPRTPEPIYPPGFDPNVMFEDDVFQAYPALFGGAIHWPIGREGPVPFNELPTGGPGDAGWMPQASRTAVAGLGGVMAASMYWTVNEGDPFGEERDPVTQFTNNLEAKPVPKGQGIVWSVGADLIDDGGIWQSNIGSNRGDLIFLVPPAVKWVPVKK